MALMGIRELRNNASEVLRKVREEGAEYIITYQGQPVALLLPVDSQRIEAAMLQAGKAETGSGWDAYQRLADELRTHWAAGGPSTQELLHDVRG